MTSQLILANGYGVALASDSAVTFGDSRTYETSEKVFPLPDPHRLAVVAAGAAFFFHLPIDVVLKKWITSLGDEPALSVQEYCDQFSSWLARNLDELVPPERREREALDYLKYSTLKNDSEFVRKQVEQAESSGAVLTTTGRRRGAEEISKYIEDRTMHLFRKRNGRHKKFPNSHVISADMVESSGISAKLVEQTFEKLSAGVDDDRQSLTDLIEESFDGLPRSAAMDQEIHLSIKLAIQKDPNFPSGSPISLSFAGYGSDDLLPEIANVRLGGALGSHVWSRPVPVTYRSDEDGSLFYRVHTQGQAAQILQFLRGSDEQAGREILKRTDAEVRAAWRDRQASDGSIATFSRVYDEVIESFIEQTERWTREEHIYRTMWTLAGLPLGELADAAQSLVNLQVLKQTVMGRLPTVGGPINVVTITLNEGTQWRNRKD